MEQKKSLFYAFMLNRWMFDGLTEEELMMYAPRFISTEEANEIMLAPQKNKE